METELNEAPLEVSVFYQARRGDMFISKWIQVHPRALDGFVIRNARIENMRFKEMVEGVAPQPRYPKTYEDHQDSVHTEPDQVTTTPARQTIRLRRPFSRYRDLLGLSGGAVLLHGVAVGQGVVLPARGSGDGAAGLRAAFGRTRDGAGYHRGIQRLAGDRFQAL